MSDDLNTNDPGGPPPGIGDLGAGVSEPELREPAQPKERVEEAVQQPEQTSEDDSGGELSPFESAMIALQEQDPKEFERVIAALEEKEEAASESTTESTTVASTPEEQTRTPSGGPDESRHGSYNPNSIEARDESLRISNRVQFLEDEVASSRAKINELVDQIDGADKAIAELEESGMSESSAHASITSARNQQYALYEKWREYYNNINRESRIIKQVQRDVQIIPELASAQRDYLLLIANGKITNDTSIADRLRLVNEARAASGKPPLNQSERAAVTGEKKFDKTAALTRLRKLTTAKPTPSSDSGSGGQSTTDLSKFPPDMQEAMQYPL